MRQEIDLSMTLPYDEQYHFDNAADVIAQAVDMLVQHCHARSYNAGWWRDPLTGKTLIPGEEEERFLPEDEITKDRYFPYVVATKIALIHSEVSEMLEAVRVDAFDGKMPVYKGVTAEGADVVIRVCDLIGMFMQKEASEQQTLSTFHIAVCAYNLSGAILEKLTVNKTRVDHSMEARLKPNGKKF